MSELSLRAQGRLLWHYLLPERVKLALLSLVIAVLLLIQLLSPQIVQRFIDMAERRIPLSVLLVMAGGYCAIGVINQGVAIVEAFLAQSLAWSVTNRVRLDLLRHCLRLDRSFHAGRTPGELIERVDGDVSNLANFFSRFVIYVAGNALLLVGVLVMLFRIDWRVGMTMAVFASVALLVLFGARNWAGKRWAAVRQAYAELYGFIGERLAALEDLKANGAISFTLVQLQHIFVRLLPREMKSGEAWAVTDNVSYGIFLAGTAMSLLWAGFLYQRHFISLGVAYLIFQYNDLLRQPLDQIRNQLQDLQRAVAGLMRIQALFAIQPEIVDGSGCWVPQGALSLEFDHVTFAYDHDEAPVLNDFSLVIPAGRRLAVLGHTGSGKTTFSRLIVRFHDPQRGTIFVGGHDLRSWHLADLRCRLGVVTQDVQLFQSSLRDNLTLFDHSLHDSDLIEALEHCGLGDWLSRLSQGLDTILQPQGLSAGEAQLLAFTRVLLRDPDLLILDEASSRLDPATERQIRVVIERLLAGRTAIVIAHRLSTLDLVDDVLILARGKVVEYGTHSDLLADTSSELSRLLRQGLEMDVIA